MYELFNSVGKTNPVLSLWRTLDNLEGVGLIKLNFNYEDLENLYIRGDWPKSNKEVECL